MEEIKIKLPENLKERKVQLQRAMEKMVLEEEKRKTLSLLFEKLLSGGKQIPDEELVEMGRMVKKGRYTKLKEQGLV